MMKRITNFLDEHPFSVIGAYYVTLAVLGFAFLTPLSAQVKAPDANYVKEWRCPYCHHHWRYGQKCENGNCPTTQWD